MLDLGDFRDSLTNAGIETDSEMYHAIIDAAVALSNRQLNSDQIKYALGFISEYGLNQMENTLTIPDEAWAPFDYGNVRVGEYVKVKPDAYDSATGWVHNGRLGVVTNVSGRRCTVRYLTNTDPDATQQHPLDKLLSIRFVLKSNFTPTTS